MKIKFCVIFITVFILSCNKSEKVKLNLEDPKDNLNAWIKIRGSLDTNKTTVYWWAGSVYAQVPNKKPQLILNFEGINVAVMKQIKGGYRMLTRECGFYKDINTNKIIETWQNPYNGKDVKVVQVWNDPVNQTFLEDYGDEKWYLPYQLLGDDLQIFFDVHLQYPNVLDTANYAIYSAGNDYIASEMFNFFANINDVNNEELNSVPNTITWTRIGQWLPWMQMGKTPGQLIYQCRGEKLNYYQDVPQAFRDYVAAQNPEYANAPEKDIKPNETSWSYFKKQIENKKY